jgi:hypothetical protein
MAKNDVSVAVTMAQVLAYATQEGLPISTPENVKEAKALLLASLAPTTEKEAGKARKPSEMSEYAILVIVGDVRNGDARIEFCGSAVAKRGKATDATPLTPFVDFAEMRILTLQSQGEHAVMLKVKASDIGLADADDDNSNDYE